MTESILSIALRTERDVVQARQRARELAALLGFDNQDQIRLATSTSEIARNAFRYARNGNVDFSVQLGNSQQMEITVSDSGPGIANLEAILDGRYRSATGMGMGILGTKRLMDEFELTSGASGTRARMVKRIPRYAPVLTSSLLHDVAERLRSRESDNPYSEIERQNQELLKTLQELRARQEELSLLNRELEDTNRGVVALYAELDERADYLRRASDLKTKFLSNVSHEFRTPLNSIISLARLLMDKLDGDLTPEQEKQVRYIESSARDLQEMVNDLLDLAKVEAGKIRIRTKTFEVHELFSALKGMLKPLLADNTAVDLNFEDPVGIPPLHTDEGKVSQIVRNLISNALKFTPNGRVTVCAKSAPHGCVRIEVTDTGIGIPPEYHETIFQEFSQIENPLQERHRGTGLGLPLCRNLALLLGGSLSVESAIGEGSTFAVEIPMIYVGETAPIQTGDLPSPEFQRAPVLIIEDNPETASLFESYLRSSEFQPIVATNLSQAQSWIDRHTPAVVVSDILMGEDTAWGFVGSMRRNLPHIPIVLTSAYDLSVRALAEGASQFLIKPVKRERLLGELRRLTSQSGTRRLLIVDDNEVSRYILRELLNRPWLDLVEAKNGSEALERIEQMVPHALILDLLMPDVSGIEVLRRLRSSRATEDLPVLIYTSKVLTAEERALIESLGATVIRKEDISTRLSAQPFFEWLTRVGVSPEAGVSQLNG